jgi:hypothetical protein
LRTLVTFLLLLAATVLFSNFAIAQTKIFQVDPGGTLTNGLQAYFEFEDNFLDFYNSNNLACGGSPCFVGYAGGKIGFGTYSAEGGLTSGGNYLFVNNNLNIDSAGADFTFACWVQMLTPPSPDSIAFTTILAHLDSGSQDRKVLAVFFDGSIYYVAVSYHGGLFEAVFPFNAITDGAFHFLVLRHANSVMEAWADNVNLGSVNGTGTGGYPATNQFTTFAAEPDNFLGVVDELGIWNRALTTSEMAELYNNGNGQTMIYAQEGTITVTTNLTAATFTVNGPANYAGGGTSATFSNAPVGTYTITFGAIPGYTTPVPQTQTVSAGGTIGFVGNYSPLPSLIVSPSSPQLTYKTGTGKSFPPQSFNITSSTGSAQAVSVTLSTNPSGGFWLAATQPTGSTPTTTIVTVAPGLPPGIYSAEITITAAGVANSPLVVPLTLTVIAGPSASLVFPVKDSFPANCSGGGTCNPYTTNIFAVVDHSMRHAFESNLVYNKNTKKCVANPNGTPSGWGTITDFEGEQATLSPSPHGYGTCGTLYGYTNANEVPFLTTFESLASFNYHGAPNTYLWYDGHPGYDYPFPMSPTLTEVYPAISGCVSYQVPASGGSTQALYHTLAIIPSSSQPPGGCETTSEPLPKSGTKYVVFYLHLASYVATDGSGQMLYCQSLPTNKSTTCPNPAPCTICPLEGTWVNTSQPIAYVGDFSDGKWGGVFPHLHFEVDYMPAPAPNVSGAPLDPYGWWSAAPDPYTTSTGLVNTWLWQ